MPQDKIDGAAGLLGEEPRVVVHLIHGTWPFGPFPKLYRSKEAGWFQEQSAFHGYLQDQLRAEAVHIDGTFVWSGANSFSARSEAARALTQKLQSVYWQYPAARQVVVAHSHGGTLAAEALSEMGFSRDPALNSVKLFICMSTPFVYLTTQDSGSTLSLSIAFASLTVSSVLLGLIFWTNLLSFSLAWFWAIAVALMLVFSFLWGVLLLGPSKYQNQLGLAYWIRVVLMRTTRDEASLVIGLSQAVHRLAETFYKPARLGVSLVASVYFAMPVYLVLKHSAWFANRLNTRQQLAVAALLAFNLLPLFYAGATFLLAVSTGVRSPRTWHSHAVEVEPCPPTGPFCEMKTFQVDSQSSGGLRHSRVYQHESAVWEIVERIRREAAGQAEDRPAPGAG